MDSRDWFHPMASRSYGTPAREIPTVWLRWPRWVRAARAAGDSAIAEFVRNGPFFAALGGGLPEQVSRAHPFELARRAPLCEYHVVDGQFIDRLGAHLRTERHGNNFFPRPHIRGFLAWLVLTVLAQWPIHTASAETFRPNLTQYGHLSWRIQDGAVAGTVNGIAQTKDGYLWIATAGGLARFDGTQFQPWTIPGSQAAHSVLATRDGTLWVGAGNDVVHIHGGRSDLIKNIAGRVFAFVESPDSSLWLVRSGIRDHGGPLCNLKGGSIRCYGKAEGIQCPYATALAQDHQGQLWMGGDSGVCTWRPAGSQFFAVQDKSFLSLQAATAIAARPDGSILVGYIRQGAELGLQSIASGKSVPFKADGLDGATLAVTALLVDREGGIWVGTDHDGVYHVAGGKADHFTTADGLTGNNIQSLYEDREGSIWVGTTGGLDQFHRVAVVPFSMREGLSSEQVAAVLASRDGTIWISSTQGIDVLRDGKVTFIQRRDGLPGEAATSFFEDHAGRIWAGVDNDLAIYGGGKFTLVRKPGGVPLGVILQMAEDAIHDVWALSAGRSYRLYRVRDDRFLDEVRLPAGHPTRIASDGDGTILVSLEDGQLVRYRGGLLLGVDKGRTPTSFTQLVAGPDGSILSANTTGLFHGVRGKWSRLGIAGGLPCEHVLGMAFDKAGSLWLRLQCGIAIIDARSLRRFWQNPSNRVAVTLLDVTDGARPGVPSFTPAATRAPNGTLWFATDGLLLATDPANLRTNTLPPPVHVERIVADHRTYAAAAETRLPPLTRDVEIDYSGLSFVVPQKVRYRYRMLGLDESWQDVGARRAAFFMNLAPGDYTFQVKASNNSGVWSPAGDSIRFTILPAFYQTLWFKLAAAAAFVILLWLAFSMRLRAAASQIEARLSERQAERTRIARELHDTLLQGFQALVLRFQNILDKIPAAEPVHDLIEQELERADAVLAEGRNRVRDIRGSAKTASLKEIFADAAAGTGASSPGAFEFVESGTPRDLHPVVRDEIAKIGFEAICNAAKHARAANIEARLTYGSNLLLLRVSDDGVGIDPHALGESGSPGHYGLVGMRERAQRIQAKFKIDSVKGSGTTVELAVPSAVAYEKQAGWRRWLPLFGRPALGD
jgi:signal transduction histidine kinase/ligand-binding sensor domain-containing protein